VYCSAGGVNGEERIKPCLRLGPILAHFSWEAWVILEHQLGGGVNWVGGRRGGGRCLGAAHSGIARDGPACLTLV
jgi:hypothetical protein